jgi:hypothetical protein
LPGKRALRKEVNPMDVWVWVVIAAAVLVLVVGVWMLAARRRRTQLRERFGPEYERLLAERGDRREAESELTGRQKRREEMDIRPLDPAARDNYAIAWREIQARFVDGPSVAVKDADGLVTEVMRDRGYPIEDFDQRSADISVDYPVVVENYRAAQAITLRNEEGRASTEDLRQAMVHYRSLFSSLLGVDDGNDADTDVDRRDDAVDVESRENPAGRTP